ncbi:MAG TPA: EamA family transporter [Kofleriaceae bacterium]|nr:EamA family transporter [Kofleriaceae bacterium]
MENPDRFVRDVVQKPARAATLWGVQVVVLITLASAFLHALWNAGLRLERDKDGAVVVAIAVATLVAAVVAALRLALAGEAFGGWEALGFTLLAGVLEGGYFAALARALDTGALGPVYTISRGGTLLLVWPASVWLWSEELNATRLVGSFIVAAGLALCSGARGATRTAVAWSALCAVLIAGYHLAYKAALLAGGDGPAVFTVSLALATVVNVSRLGQDGRARALALARRWQLWLIGAICSVAFLLFLVGLARGGAGLVLTLRNTSVIFATLFARLIGEQPGARQVAGSVVVVLGAVLLGLR